MAWQIKKGENLIFHHPVRDVNGIFVANQAASVTKALLQPDKFPASEVVTLTDFALGWVQASFTPTLTGQYVLTLTNPAFPTADGRVTPYDINSTAGFVAGQSLLTTLDRVRTRLQLEKADGKTPIESGDPHPFDALLNLLISEVSDSIQEDLQRTFAEATYTEYLDGTGISGLVLGVGPLVSITSVESVQYDDDGAGGVTETLETIERHSYVLGGLRSQPRHTGLGRIERLGQSIWTRGPKRYKVVYVAGFDALPEKLVGYATEEVVYQLMTRESVHLLSQSLGDGTIAFIRPMQREEFRRAIMSAYRLERAA